MYVCICTYVYVYVYIQVCEFVYVYIYIDTSLRFRECRTLIETPRTRISNRLGSLLGTLKPEASKLDSYMKRFRGP